MKPDNPNFAYWPTIVDHPLINEVAEAGWEISQSTILRASVLYEYFRYLSRIQLGGNITDRANWIIHEFPEINEVEKTPIPRPLKYPELVVQVNNVGSIELAKKFGDISIAADKKIAYWTGGFEFTPAQMSAVKYLIDKGFNILLGIEPYCYPREAGKERGALAIDVVPISLWSLLLKHHGFIFQIPRPLPDHDRIDQFYDSLYLHITNAQIPSVVSPDDPYASQKRKRAPHIEIGHFSGFHTSDYYQDAISS